MYSYACMCISMHILVHVFLSMYVFSLCIYEYMYPYSSSMPTLVYTCILVFMHVCIRIPRKLNVALLQTNSVIVTQE